MVSSTARLNKELQRLKEVYQLFLIIQGLPDGCFVEGDPSKSLWKIYLKGPKDSPYESGIFALEC